MNIYQKLIEVRKEVPYLQKEAKGAQYNYTGSSQVLASLKRKMDELGLLLIPAIVGHNVSESPIELKDDKGNITKRTTTYFTELEMTFTWINAEKPDEKITSPWYGQGVDIAGEKGVGKAATYAEKYFMLKFFNIATDKDDPDAFQAKFDEKARTVPVKLIGDIKTEWMKKGLKPNALDAQTEKLYGAKLMGLTEEQAQDFYDKLIGKKEAV